jgi:hypothetical protein
MNPHELRAHRRQIDALIRANPFPLRLQRQVKLATAGGGYQAHPTSLPEQEFLLVETAGRGRLEGTISRAEGELLKADFVLIGRYNVTLERGDCFDYAGNYLEIYYISPYREIRVAAGCKFLGGRNTEEMKGA